MGAPLGNKCGVDDKLLSGHGWHTMDYTMAAMITACTQSPGQVFKIPQETITSSLTGVSGLTGCYVSGFMDTTTLTPTVSGLGAFILERHDGGTGKGYGFEFVMDREGKLWYHAVPKIKPEHHFKVGEEINVDVLFSKSPYFKTLAGT